MEGLKYDEKIRNLWSESIHNRSKRHNIRADAFYDFIIVGAGTAGCVLARELIYNIPNINILVLEAGPSNTQVNGRMREPCTYGSFDTASNEIEIDWGYTTESQKMPSIIDPTKEVSYNGSFYPRGKVVGGCSSVNGMIYIRGQKFDYDLWAAQSPEYKIWDYEHCLEAFKATENNTRENPDEEFKKYHGSEGLLHVQDVEIQDITKDIVKSAKNLGIPDNNDFNGAKQNGMGIYQYTMKSGKRFSLADGYLADALKKVEICPPPHIGGVRKIVSVNVKSSAHVLNIIWDEEKKDENVAIGVKYFYDGVVYNAFIAPKGELILCGGAINSPQILMLSGIGPKNNLEEYNIKVRKELPVGHNLLDHVGSVISAKVSVPGNYNSWGSELGFFHKGNVEGKFPSQEELLDEHPDMQCYVVTRIMDPDLVDETSKKNIQGLSLISVLNYPSSVGHLELCSSNPFSPPKLFLNYYEKPDDLYRMISSLKLLRELCKQLSLNDVWGVKEIGFDDEFGKWCSSDGKMHDEDWERYILSKAHSSFHPCGTVKMAPESQGGCVNHRLQVYGTKNLR
ncbi:21205_t:CDS:2, partial [Racocetra persica]